MIVSIHQPNFFPWMGFFDKINKSDQFIFLTGSTRSKNDKYLTRTKVLNNTKSQYLSVPLGIKQISIKQLMMPADNRWKVKILNIIKESYRSSNYFDEVYDNIEELLMCEYEYFSDYSINIIKFLISKFNIDTELHIDTDFNQDFGVSNQRNISLCKKVGGDIYLSGSGAKVYNDNKLYSENSLDLIYQDYVAPTYVQMSNEFISGLSIIDVLFNCGFEGAEKLLKQSC
jgi:hypothetical protein